MSEKKVGIDSTILIMETMVAIGTDIGKALDDRKLSLAESLAMVKHAPALLGMIKAAPQLPAELKDLDADEREAVVAHFCEKFDLPNEQIELRVERLFSVAVNLSVEIVEIIDIVKEFRAKD